MKSYLYYEEQFTVRRPNGGSTPPKKDDDDPLTGCFAVLFFGFLVLMAIKGCAS